MLIHDLEERTKALKMTCQIALYPIEFDDKGVTAAWRSRYDALVARSTRTMIKKYKRHIGFPDKDYLNLIEKVPLYKKLREDSIL